MPADLYSCLKSVLGFAGCTFFSLTAIAQDDEPAASSVENRAMTIVAADDGSGGPPMVISAMSSSLDGQPARFSFVSPSAEGLPFISAGMQFAGMGPADPLSLIHNPDIQKEIELVGQQLDDYKKLNSDYQKKMEDFPFDLREGRIEQDKMKEFATSMKQLREEQSERFRKMLLPHQINRLEQISKQQFLQSAGTAAALSNKLLMEQLGISEEQVERLKKRNEEVSKELKEKIEELQADAKEKILAELTSEQREKLKQLTGKKYQFKTPEFPKTNPVVRQRIQPRNDREEN